MDRDLKWSDYDFTKIPFDDIVQFGQQTLLYKDIFTVSWLLGRYCNYKCSYCWPYARSDSKDFRPTKLCLLTIDSIKQQARDNGFNSFHFSFSGGEPTLHPGYLDILEYLRQDISNTNFTSIHMTTNCSQSTIWFEKYLKTIEQFQSVDLTASFHPEYVNTQEKKKIFADKLVLCQQHNIDVAINMVMVPTKFYDQYDDALYFHDRGLNVTLKPQSDPTACKIVDEYTTDMLQILQTGMPRLDRSSETLEQYMSVAMFDSSGKKWYLDSAERFNSFNFNKFKGWLCNSGFQGIIIREPDGSIKRSYSCHDAPLGNIETGFELFKNPTECITDSCVSSADSKLPKKKII